MPRLPFLTLVVLLVAVVDPAHAQIYASSSGVLSSTTFSTPVYTPSVTFTPVTTYASAETRTVTSIVGVGPSLTTNTYTYVYSEPLSTISGTDLASVYSSLAAAGSPTAATGALTPDSTNLQIVPDSSGRLTEKSSMALVMLASVLSIVCFNLV